MALHGSPAARNAAFVLSVYLLGSLSSPPPHSLHKTESGVRVLNSKKDFNSWFDGYSGNTLVVDWPLVIE